MNAQRISKPVGITMIAFAIFFDGIQFLLMFIPIIGWVFASLVSVAAGFTFGFWCSHLKVHLTDSKRVLGLLGTVAGEAVPLINGMWWWTALMSYTVITVWREDTSNKEGE